MDLAPINRAIDRPERPAIWFWPRSTERSINMVLAWVQLAGWSTGNPNGLKYDRWPVDRQFI